MNNTETAQQLLFNDDTSLKNSMKLVIEDHDEKQKYLLDEIRNKVVLGEN